MSKSSALNLSRMHTSRMLSMSRMHASHVLSIFRMHIAVKRIAPGRQCDSHRTRARILQYRIERAPHLTGQAFAVDSAQIRVAIEL